MSDVTVTQVDDLLARLESHRWALFHTQTDVSSVLSDAIITITALKAKLLAISGRVEP